MKILAFAPMIVAVLSCGYAQDPAAPLKNQRQSLSRNCEAQVQAKKKLNLKIVDCYNQRPVYQMIDNVTPLHDKYPNRPYGAPPLKK